MEIRGERRWCDRCTAPAVLPENVLPIRIFLDALPAYREGGGFFGAVIVPGFARHELLALMEMHGVSPQDRPEVLLAVLELEEEFRRIRAERVAQKSRKG